MTGLIAFFVGVLTLAGIYAILTMILNLLAGWGGMWDLGIAGMVAVGSYVFIITTQSNQTDVMFMPQWPTWAGILLASLAGALVALIIGAPSLRVRGLYFMITTLAFAEVIRQLAINLAPLTRGVVGFNQFGRPLEGLVPGDYRVFLLGLVWVVAVAVYFMMLRLAGAPFGRLLRAFRDNDPLALSLGKQTNRRRIQAYVLSGLLIGAVAPLYVWYVRSVVPNLFSSDITFIAWTALALGGFGSKSGPVIGALILLLLTETVGLLQGTIPAEFIVLLSSARYIILGVVLMLIMRLRPQGLVPESRSFSAAAKRVAAQNSARS